MPQDKHEEYVIPAYRGFRTFYHSQTYFQYAKQRLYKVIEEDKVDSLLDVGCGHALDCQPIMELGVEYVGVDPVEKNLQLAREDNPDGEFKLGYAQELPYPDNSFDAVYMGTVWDILPDIQQMKKAIEECLRVARRYVYSLEATTQPRFMMERYMMIPMDYGLSITRVNYNPEKKKADYLWRIDMEGIK